MTDNFFKALNGCEILEVGRVRDLARRPFTFVGGIVNHGGIPLALVSGVGLVWTDVRVSLEVITEEFQLTPSRDRIQMPPCIWGSQRRDQSIHHLLRHPTLPASRHLKTI